MIRQTGISTRFWKIIPLVILVVGCVPLHATPTTSQPPAQISNPPVVQATSASATQPPAQTIPAPATQPPETATMPPEASKTIPPSNVPLTLTITSPTDQASVSQPSVEVSGSVSTDAVLTINDDIYDLPAGSFSETVALAQGPNAIEIVASNMSGNEVDKVLTVTYQP